MTNVGLVIAGLLLAITAAAQDVTPDLVYPVHADHSRPLKVMAASVAASPWLHLAPFKIDLRIPARIEQTSTDFESSRIKPVLADDDYDNDDSKGIDDALQLGASRMLPIVPISGFEGLGTGFSHQGVRFTNANAVPDPVGAIGTDHYVQVVNLSLAIFDRHGVVVMPPVATSVLWQGFGGNCEQSPAGDAIVLFDRNDRRWFITQAAGAAPQHSQCMAVSLSDDPTGAYTRYEFVFDELNKNDYGKFGVWCDAYYGTYIMFNNDDPDVSIGSAVCAYDRIQMVRGRLDAAAQCVSLTTGALLPSDAEGLAPGGLPNFIVGLQKDRIQIRRFVVDWTTPSNSRLHAPVDVPVRPFVKPERAFSVAQATPGVGLDPIGDRLMFRCSYREVGSISGLFINHTVKVSRFGRYTAGIRWYEIRDPQGTPWVAQQSSFAPTDEARWMASIGSDKMGNVAIGYSVASARVAPSLYIAGRSFLDTPSTLAAEQIAKLGSGTTSEARWGDYASMTLDPVDDCTFWFTGEYILDPKGTPEWRTYIAQTKFLDCD